MKAAKTTQVPTEELVPTMMTHTQTSSSSSEALAEMFKELRLKHWTAAMLTDMESMAPSEKDFLLKYMTKWSQTEKAERRSQLIATRIKSAKFKRQQTIDTFDFAHSKATQGIQRAYLTLYESIAPGSLPSAVFTGNAGLGKTHLARALGYAACQKGLSALFITAAEMVNMLSAAQKTFTLESELNKYRRPHVLIIDELGFVPLSKTGAELLFELISQRYERGSIMITSNLPFDEWTETFGSERLTGALLDRLTHHVNLLEVNGESYRLANSRARKAG